MPRMRGLLTFLAGAFWTIGLTAAQSRAARGAATAGPSAAPRRPRIRRSGDTAGMGASDREAGRRNGAIVPVASRLRRRRGEADRRHGRPGPSAAAPAPPAVPGLPGPSAPRASQGREGFEQAASRSHPGQRAGARGTAARRGDRDLRSRRRRGRSREAVPPRPVAGAAPLRGALHLVPPQEDAGEHGQLGRGAGGARGGRGTRPRRQGAPPRVHRQASRRWRSRPATPPGGPGCASATRARRTSRPIGRTWSAQEAFQEVYNRIANDLLRARDELAGETPWWSCAAWPCCASPPSSSPRPTSPT